MEIFSFGTGLRKVPCILKAALPLSSTSYVKQGTVKTAGHADVFILDDDSSRSRTSICQINVKTICCMIMINYKIKAVTVLA